MRCYELDLSFLSRVQKICDSYSVVGTGGQGVGGLLSSRSASLISIRRRSRLYPPQFSDLSRTNQNKFYQLFKGLLCFFCQKLNQRSGKNNTKINALVGESESIPILRFMNDQQEFYAIRRFIRCHFRLYFILHIKHKVQSK